MKYNKNQNELYTKLYRQPEEGDISITTPDIEYIDISPRTIAYHGNAVPGYLTVTLRTVESTRGHITVSGNNISTKINLSTTEYKTEHMVYWAPYNDATNQQLPPGNYTLRLNLYKQDGDSSVGIPVGSITVVNEPNPLKLIGNITVDPLLISPKYAVNEPLTTITFKLNRPAVVYPTIKSANVNFSPMRLEPGIHSFSWNGRDTSGNILPDGEYILCFRAIELSFNYPSNTPAFIAGACTKPIIIKGGEYSIPEARLREIVTDVTLDKSTLNLATEDSIKGTITLSKRVQISIYVANSANVHENVLVSYADLEPGTHSFSWDGRNMMGSKVANGPYYLRVSVMENNQNGYLSLPDKSIDVTGSYDIQPSIPLQRVRVKVDYSQMEVEPLFQGFTAYKGDIFPIIQTTPQYGMTLSYYVKIGESAAGFIKVSDVEWIDLDRLPIQWVRTVTNADIRNVPDNNAPVISYITSGTYLRMLSKENNWYRVVLDNGNQVYIRTNDAVVETYPPTQNGIVHTIVAGDTLWKLAQQYNTTIDAIVKANNLILNDYLRIGQKLNIPKTPPVGSTIYTIKRGDTLWKIAQSFDITVLELARANNLNVNDSIYIGNTLVIPKVHIVKWGDSLWKIAQQYNTTINKISSINDLDVNKPIIVGQRILIV